jgi:uncharacterized membrane protein YhhN
MAQLIPIPFLAVTVTLLVRAKLIHNRRQEFIFKPLSSALFVLIALLSLLTPAVRPWYTALITLGLLFGLGGDVALMLGSRKAFLVGLVLFLIGHIIYAIVWTAANGFYPQDLISAAVLAVVGVAAFAYLRPGLGSMQAPVFLYVLVICFMVNRGLSTFSGSYFTTTQAWLISAGAILFWLSDLMLAVNRFRRPFRAEPVGLFLYYGGQALIALSASYFG